MKFLLSFFLSLLTGTVLLLAACAGIPGHEQRLAMAAGATAAHGWRSNVITTQTFPLASWQPAAITPSDLLTVYIEGDGLAWLSPTRPSDDPTPLNPVALKLALAQTVGNAAYIARPCQYGGIVHAGCQQPYWTGKRFAPEVISAMNDALLQLKTRFGATRLVLVGYSGGAAVTALLAQQRDDIAAWITVAGNIDHRAWTSYHHMTPLDGSLDPLQNAARLAAIPQWHFVGANDQVVPAGPTQRFVASMPQARVIVRQGYDHGCCWQDRWAEDFAGIAADIEGSARARPMPYTDSRE